jgi:uncharacterized membrane protein
MKKFLEKFSNYYIIFLVYALIGWLYEVFLMWFVFEPYKFVNRGVLLGPFLPIYGFGVLLLLVCVQKFMKKKHTLENPIYLIISSITVVSFIYITIIEYTTPKIYSVEVLFKNYGIQLVLTNIVIILALFLLTKLYKKLSKINVTPVLVFLIIWILTTLLEYVSHLVIDKCFGNILWDYSKDFLNINARVNWDASRNFAIGGTLLLYTIQPLIDKFLNKTKLKTRYIIALVIGIPMLLDFLLHVVLKVI